MLSHKKVDLKRESPTNENDASKNSLKTAGQAAHLQSPETLVFPIQPKSNDNSSINNNIYNNNGNNNSHNLTGSGGNDKANNIKMFKTSNDISSSSKNRSNNKESVKKRITLLSLPLEKKAFPYSSDDNEAPYLTQKLS